MEISTIKKSLKKFGLNFNNKIVRAIHEMHKNESDSDNSNNEFDFKVYINGHEDLIQEEVYIDYDTTISSNIYGDVATDILNNINPLIFNILNNKLYIEIEATEEGFYDVNVRKEDNRETPFGRTIISIEESTEIPSKPVMVVGDFFINSEEDEKYLKANSFIALFILQALENIDASHFIDATNKYSNNQ